MPLSHHPSAAAPAAAPGGPVSIGFNFRDGGALPYPPGDNWVGDAVNYAYPTDFTDSEGGTIRAGWHAGAGSNFDNTTSVNRLAGAQAAQGAFWRIALPIGSSWRFRFGAFIYVANTMDIQIYDGLQLNLLYNHTSAAASANEAIDILGNITTDLVWESDYESRYVDVGPVTDTAGADSGLSVTYVGSGLYWSHIRVEEL